MSSMSYAQMTLEGRLTRDPEMITTVNGNTMCKFRVAVNRKTGKDTEKASFINVVVFDREAVLCGKYLTQGRSVMVSGRFETDEYVDKNDINRTSFSVVAQVVQFGSGGRSSEDEQGAAEKRDSRDTPRGNYSGKGNTRNRDSSRKKAEGYLEKNRGRGYDS